MISFSIALVLLSFALLSVNDYYFFRKWSNVFTKYEAFTCNVRDDLVQLIFRSITPCPKRIIIIALF